MAVLDNTTTAADLLSTLDVEFAANFTQELDRLTEVLGITGVETVAAGTAMYTKKITGTLGEEVAAEGDVAPLTKYTYEKKSIGEIKIERRDKLTTVEAIQKSGREDAITRTDRKMLRDLRGLVLANFFKFLKAQADESGTTATGEGLQKTLALMQSEIQKVLEKNNDVVDGQIVWFVNPDDIWGYLAEAGISTQTAFGMTYLQNFLGVNGTIFSTINVDKGTIIATPAENLHLYGVDFGTIADCGLDYETLDSGIIGVHHAPDYTRGSVYTHTILSANLLAEVQDYIVKGTVTPLV